MFDSYVCVCVFGFCFIISPSYIFSPYFHLVRSVSTTIFHPHDEIDQKNTFTIIDIVVYARIKADYQWLLCLTCNQKEFYYFLLVFAPSLALSLTFTRIRFTKMKLGNTAACGIRLIQNVHAALRWKNFPARVLWQKYLHHSNCITWASIIIISLESQ